MGGPGAGRGSAPAPAPPSPDRRPAVHTVTLDGSLLSAQPGPRGAGSPASSGARGGARGSAASSGARRPSPAGSPQRQPRREDAGPVLLDKGESEAAFIASLRTHYSRNGTAESFAPTFKAAPHKHYSSTGGGGPGAGGGDEGGEEGLSGRTRLQQQEQEIWEEREEELVVAQERRFAQLEDALAAREAKREAYLVHRLEATAAEKIAEHRRRQEAAHKQRHLAVQRAQHLPALHQAQAATQPAGATAALQKLVGKPVFPAAAHLAAAVGQATASISSLPGISTLQAGLESGKVRVPGAEGEAGAWRLPGEERPGWQERKQAAAACQVDAVYAELQGAKEAGGRLLSPLDAAKAAMALKQKALRQQALGRRGKAGIDASHEAGCTGSEASWQSEGFADALAASYAARQQAAAGPGSGRGGGEGGGAAVGQQAAAPAARAAGVAEEKAEGEEQPEEQQDQLQAEPAHVQEPAPQQADSAEPAQEPTFALRASASLPPPAFEHPPVEPAAAAVTEAANGEQSDAPAAAPAQQQEEELSVPPEATGCPAEEVAAAQLPDGRGGPAELPAVEEGREDAEEAEPQQQEVQDGGTAAKAGKEGEDAPAVPAEASAVAVPQQQAEEVEEAPAEVAVEVGLGQAPELSCQVQQLVEGHLLELAASSLSLAVEQAESGETGGASQQGQVAAGAEAEEEGAAEPSIQGVVPAHSLLAVTADLDSAEAVGLTQRASASLLFGGGPAGEQVGGQGGAGSQPGF